MGYHHISSKYLSILPPIHVGIHSHSEIFFYKKVFGSLDQKGVPFYELYHHRKSDMLQRR
jgi:hypothetical protein